jgi:hypothetical protein
MRLVIGEVWAAKCEGEGYGRKDNMTRRLLPRLTSQLLTHSRLLLAQVGGPKNLHWHVALLALRNSGTQTPSHKATQPQSYPATKLPSHNSSPQPHVSSHTFQPPTSPSSPPCKHNTNDNGPATPAPCLHTRSPFLKNGSKGHATSTWHPIPATRHSSWRTHHSWGDLPTVGCFSMHTGDWRCQCAQRSAQG